MRGDAGPVMRRRGLTALRCHVAYAALGVTTQRNARPAAGIGIASDIVRWSGGCGGLCSRIVLWCDVAVDAKIQLSQLGLTSTLVRPRRFSSPFEVTCAHPTYVQLLIGGFDCCHRKYCQTSCVEPSSVELTAWCPRRKRNVANVSVAMHISNKDFNVSE